MTLRNGDPKGKVSLDLTVAGEGGPRGFVVLHRSLLALVTVTPGAIAYQHVGENSDRHINIGALYPENTTRTPRRVRQPPRRAERIGRVAALTQMMARSIIDEDQDVIWTYDLSGEWTRIPDET